MSSFRLITTAIIGVNMGMYFQPDMTKVKELSAAATKHVLLRGARSEESVARLHDEVPVDFLCSIKELQPAGSFLKNSPAV